jgi:hypothetical protein
MSRRPGLPNRALPVLSTHSRLTRLPDDPTERQRYIQGNPQAIVVEVTGEDNTNSADDTRDSLPPSPVNNPWQPSHHIRIDPMSKAVYFYGKPSQLDDVITYADITNLINGIDTENNKCATLASLFRGQALHWLTATKSATPKLLDDYEEFKATLTRAFGVSDLVKVQRATQRLSTISQRGPVQLYAIEFRQIAATLKLDEQAAKAAFRRGLKLHVKEALAATAEDEGDTLEDIINEAARIDTELYSARKSSRGSSKGAGKNDGRGTIKCHNCGKFGHKANACRSKGRSDQEY